MKKNKKSILNYYYSSFLSFLPVPHLYSVHLILLLTFPFRRRRKEIISTEDERVFPAVTPRERGVVWILMMQ
jgi:hypothetical protein